jgi:hypothetical protein
MARQKHATSIAPISESRNGLGATSSRVVVLNSGRLFVSFANAFSFRSFFLKTII